MVAAGRIAAAAQIFVIKHTCVFMHNQTFLYFTKGNGSAHFHLEVMYHPVVNLGLDFQNLLT